MSASIHHIPANATPGAPLRLTRTTRLLADREQTLTGVRGLTWVTIDNELTDTVLGSGQRTTVPAHRMVVVTSLRPEADFEVSLSPAPAKRSEAALFSGARWAVGKLRSYATPNLSARSGRP